MVNVSHQQLLTHYLISSTYYTSDPCIMSGLKVQGPPIQWFQLKSNPIEKMNHHQTYYEKF